MVAEPLYSVEADIYQRVRLVQDLIELEETGEPDLSKFARVEPAMPEVRVARWSVELETASSKRNRTPSIRIPQSMLPGYGGQDDLYLCGRLGCIEKLQRAGRRTICFSELPVEDWKKIQNAVYGARIGDSVVDTLEMHGLHQREP